MFRLRTSSSTDEDVEDRKALLNNSPLLSDSSLPSRTTESRKWTVLPKTSTWALLCLLCTLVNILVLSIALRAKDPAATWSFLPLDRFSYQDIESLRRPSQFVGLDELYSAHFPPSRKLENYPILLASIDKANPSKVSNVGLEIYHPLVGSVLPDARQFRVSTIFQLRALDFRLDRCKLIVEFPNTTDPNPTHLDLFLLDQPHRIHEAQLSYSKRPKRRSLVSHITVQSGTTYTYPFASVEEEDERPWPHAMARFRARLGAEHGGVYTDLAVQSPLSPPLGHTHGYFKHKRRWMVILNSRLHSMRDPESIPTTPLPPSSLLDRILVMLKNRITHWHGLSTTSRVLKYAQGHELNLPSIILAEWNGIFKAPSCKDLPYLTTAVMITTRHVLIALNALVFLFILAPSLIAHNPFSWKKSTPVGAIQWYNSLKSIERVSMDVYDTEAYAMNDVGHQEWEAMFPHGKHTVQLYDDRNGPLPAGMNSSTFTVSLLHQMRCLTLYQVEYRKPQGDPKDIDPIIRHCLNYLRQQILCHMNTRLESSRNFKGQSKRGYALTCRDWTQVFEKAEENHLYWENH
ncbi:hypothetical protein CVT24_013039 [Panaeolus cyanescens]|uniref:Uncharacterized protein n=1 Tax=Panaeolus cyanescens TaxID=181874 RepID=A0A409YUS3_9AGAR|nr:hypothetical protein CVT24_013039 [Panaeolus cyanescens]